MQILEKNKTTTSFCNIISEKHKASNNNLNYFKKIIFKVTAYRIGFFVRTLESELQVYEIIDIVLHNGISICLFCQKLSQIQFVPHFLSFEVDLSELGGFTFLPIKDLIGPPVTLIKTAKGKFLLKVKEFFKAKI